MIQSARNAHACHTLATDLNLKSDGQTRWFEATVVLQHGTKRHPWSKLKGWLTSGTNGWKLHFDEPDDLLFEEYSTLYDVWTYDPDSRALRIEGDTRGYRSYGEYVLTVSSFTYWER